MTGIDAFIAEAAVHFKNPFQAADEEAFEVKFRRNAQEDIHIEGVVMRLKRTGCGTAGNGMEHRRFNFEEVAVIEVLADALDDFRTLNEGIRNFRVDDEVEIALTIACFLIRKAMEFFRQRTERFREELPRFDADRRFTRMGNEYRTADTDDIAEVEEFK